MNYQEMQSDVLNRVDDIDNEELADMVNTWLNQVYLDICSRYNWKFLEKTDTATITSTTTSLNLDVELTDLNKVYDVVIEDSDGVKTRLMFLPEDIFQQMYSKSKQDTTGTPKYYRIWGNTMYFYNLPDENFTVTMKYTFYTSRMVGPGDTPIFPETFHEIIVLGAAAKARQYNDDFEEADMIQKEYETKLTLMMAKLKKQITDPPRFRTSVNRQLTK